MALKTPGVYVQEVSVFPPSVAEVETAIPAFIGYTEKAERKGQDLTSVPWKVSSLLEYRQLFGGAHSIASVTVTVDPSNSFAVKSLSIPKRFYMYEALRLFFDNGGGNCYIVSVGNYSKTVQNGDATTPGLSVGLAALEKYDEPTIILFPDAPLLATDAEFYTLQQRALTQCAKLQDRVAVLDLKETTPSEWKSAYTTFRDNIGINNLKYGVAYTPWLHSAYPREVAFSIFMNSVTDGTNPVDLSTITSDKTLNGLVNTAKTAITDVEAISNSVTTLRGTQPTLSDEYARLRNALNATSDGAGATTALNALMGFVRSVALAPIAWKATVTGGNLTRDLDTYAKDSLKSAAQTLIELAKNNSVQIITGEDDAGVDTAFAGFDGLGWLTSPVSAIAESARDYSDDGSGGSLSTRDTAVEIATDVDGIFDSLTKFVNDVVEAAAIHKGLAQKTLYEGHSIIGNIVEHIKLTFATVPPSGAVAGRYAFVDSTRGVWKAPANVGLNAVTGPLVPIDDSDQEDLNIDTVGGKSINAIRTFTGRGHLIWGARTLAGNDNEWRYVPVRRFFNMVEESVKKSTAFAVFEPNSAPTWQKVKSMIENYLVQKWREGALAGATPDEAFFVRIGLGETMTAQDVLEGRLVVEIGMAAVRPAEFIILKFSHKLQES